MHKLKLKYLLFKYKKEINKGNFLHVKDLIAIMVLLDLSYTFPVYDVYNLNVITLGSIMNNNENFQLPSFEYLWDESLKIDKLLKKQKFHLELIEIKQQILGCNY